MSETYNIGDRVKCVCGVTYDFVIEIYYTGVVKDIVVDPMWGDKYYMVKIDNECTPSFPTPVVRVIPECMIFIIDKKCVCDISTIMWAGCKCGAFKK